MIETILDKGMVIDAYVRVSLVGIEVLTIDARVVIASVDTYLRFAEAVNRLDIANDGTAVGLPELGQKMSGGADRGPGSRGARTTRRVRERRRLLACQRLRSPGWLMTRGRARFRETLLAQKPHLAAACGLR